MQHFAKAKYIYILSHLNDMTIQLLQYTQYTTLRNMKAKCPSHNTIVAIHNTIHYHQVIFCNMKVNVIRKQ